MIKDSKINITEKKGFRKIVQGGIAGCSPQDWASHRVRAQYKLKGTAEPLPQLAEEVPVP